MILLLDQLLHKMILETMMRLSYKEISLKQFKTMSHKHLQRNKHNKFSQNLTSTKTANLITKNSKDTLRLKLLNTLLLMLLHSNFSPNSMLMRMSWLIRKKFRTIIKEKSTEHPRKSMPIQPLKLFKLLKLHQKPLKRPR
jgi:hypothetical protein